MVGFEKALRAVKMIKDQIQYRSQSLLDLARGYFSCICNTSLPCALHNLVVVNQIVDKNPLRIVTLFMYSNKINSLNSEQVFHSI